MAEVLDSGQLQLAFNIVHSELAKSACESFACSPFTVSQLLQKLNADAPSEGIAELGESITNSDSFRFCENHFGHPISTADVVAQVFVTSLRSGPLKAFA